MSEKSSLLQHIHSFLLCQTFPALSTCLQEVLQKKYGAMSVELVAEKDTPSNPHSVYFPLSNDEGMLVLRWKETPELSAEQKTELTDLAYIIGDIIGHVKHTDLALKEIESRDQFLSFAVHEIRTPLTTLLGYSQLLKSKFKDETSSEGRWVGEIYKETVRLTKMVEELLARK